MTLLYRMLGVVCIIVLCALLRVAWFKIDMLETRLDNVQGLVDTVRENQERLDAITADRLAAVRKNVRLSQKFEKKITEMAKEDGNDLSLVVRVPPGAVDGLQSFSNE